MILLSFIVSFLSMSMLAEAMVLAPSSTLKANLSTISDLDAPIGPSCVDSNANFPWRGSYGDKLASDCLDALLQVKIEVQSVKKNRYDFYSKQVFPSGTMEGSEFWALPQGASKGMLSSSLV